MNGGSRIVRVRPATDEEMEQAFVTDASEDTAWSIEAPDEPVRPSLVQRALPIVATLASLAWAGGMLWAARSQLPLPPVAAAQFVASLAVVPTLLAVLCLLALRSSRAEAQRFGATARAVRAETRALEESLHTLGQRIEAQRRLLQEQARALSELGDAATERLGASTANLTAEARVLESMGAAIQKSAGEVEGKLQTVFDSLPKAHAETQAMSATLTELGLSASERANALDAALVALAERGRVADEVAGGAAARLGAHIARMESSSDAAAERLEGAASEMGVAVDAVLDRAAQAVDEARKGIAAQGEAMLAMLSASQAALEKSGREGADALSARLGHVEDAIERLSERLALEHGRSDALFERVDLGVAQTAGQLDRLHASGTAKAQELATSLSALDASTVAMTETMRVGEGTARAMIATAEELLLALDASAREIDETLPEALARLDGSIADSRRIVGTAKPELLALVTAAESTHVAVEAVAALVTTEREKLDHITRSLTEALDVGQDKASVMESVVEGAIAKTRAFAEDAAPALLEALARIRETADRAATSAREVLGSVVPDAARAMETASADAVRAALARALPGPMAELAATSEMAVVAASRASERLTQQLVTISETSAQIAQRIEAEQAAREKGDQDNFARRVALLIEALNSASIDIAKTFAHEVSDSAWAAYLKGDRGVFTRRAVRLLDNHEAREVVRLYDHDDAFREHVNRYIHDFEAMLRQILSLRDGSTMGITLLSSDMGKLYVALAQAIERLRT